MTAKNPKDLSAKRKQHRIEALYHAAERVSRHFGQDENGVLSDWSEWVNLRQALKAAYDARDISRN